MMKNQSPSILPFLIFHLSLICTKQVIDLFKNLQGNSLAVLWLGLCSFTAESSGSLPGQGTKILCKPHDAAKTTTKTFKDGTFASVRVKYKTRQN